MYWIRLKGRETIFIGKCSKCWSVIWDDDVDDDDDTLLTNRNDLDRSLKTISDNKCYLKMIIDLAYIIYEKKNFEIFYDFFKS